MSTIYGPNTRLVVAFLRMLAALTEGERDRAILADPSRKPHASAEYAQWHGAWSELQAANRRTGRMTAAGAAWPAVWDVLNGEERDPSKRSPLTITARNVCDALIGWDLITAEQRRILWAPFAGIFPDPNAAIAA